MGSRLNLQFQALELNKGLALLLDEAHVRTQCDFDSGHSSAGMPSAVQRPAGGLDLTGFLFPK